MKNKKPQNRIKPTKQKRQPKPSARRGFSLPEVMVSVGMLATVIVASTSLLIRTSRSNSINANKITAYYLAQEGLELVRNIRDSNWLQGLSWRGELLGEAQLTKKALNKGTYIVDKRGLGKIRKNLTQIKNITVNNSDKLKNLAPWTLEETKCKLDKTTNKPNDSKCNNTKLYLYEIEDKKTKFYSHDKNLNQAKKTRESIFHRFIKIEKIKEDTLKLKITSVVAWNDESGGYKKLELETELTDWKQGPL